MLTRSRCQLQRQHGLKASEARPRTQKDTQTFREKALTDIKEQLKTCIIRYEEFGKEKWVEACKHTSLVNILDQHFAVQLKIMPPAGIDIEDDEDNEIRMGNEFCEYHDPDLSNETKKQPMNEKLSIFLFSAAIYESKRLIDKDIRKRRAQITHIRLQDAAVKTKQDMVDIKASSIKPNDATRMLGDRSWQQDEELSAQSSRLDALKGSQAKLGLPADKVSTAARLDSTSESMIVETSAGKQDDDEISALLWDQVLILNKMNMLELGFDILKPVQHPAAKTTASAINAPSTAPKNDSRDNDQEPSKRAQKRAKKKLQQLRRWRQRIRSPRPPPSPDGTATALQGRKCNIRWAQI
jgi:hypothetical protein